MRVGGTIKAWTGLPQADKVLSAPRDGVQALIGQVCCRTCYDHRRSTSPRYVLITRFSCVCCLFCTFLFVVCHANRDDSQGSAREVGPELDGVDAKIAFDIAIGRYDMSISGTRRGLGQIRNAQNESMRRVVSVFQYLVIGAILIPFALCWQSQHHARPLQERPHPSG